MLPPDQRKKPDLFATWAPFLAGTVAQGSCIPTGKLASRALQLDECAIEFYEGKLGSGSLTATDFGQLLDYHSRVTGEIRGMLFNARHFWLYKSLRHIPLSLTQGELGASGSLAALQDFFAGAREPPLLRLLRYLMERLDATLWSPPSGTFVPSVGSAEHGVLSPEASSFPASGGSPIGSSLASLSAALTGTPPTPFCPLSGCGWLRASVFCAAPGYHRALRPQGLPYIEPQ